MRLNPRFRLKKKKNTYRQHLRGHQVCSGQTGGMGTPCLTHCKTHFLRNAKIFIDIHWIIFQEKAVTLWYNLWTFLRISPMHHIDTEEVTKFLQKFVTLQSRCKIQKSLQRRSYCEHLVSRNTRTAAKLKSNVLYFDPGIQVQRTSSTFYFHAVSFFGW
jgi:hypothetical protein